MDDVLDMTFQQIDLAVQSILEAKARQLQELLDPIFSALGNGIKYKAPQVYRRGERPPGSPQQDPAMTEMALLAQMQMMGLPFRQE